jgi:hypothetical protein
MTEEYEMQLEQLIEKIRTQKSVSCEELAAAASLLLHATHETKLWRLIKTLRAATDKGMLPKVAEAKVEKAVNGNGHIEPYLRPWRELDRKILKTWSRTDGSIFRHLSSGVRNKEKILQLYSRYLRLKQTDEIEFQKYQEYILSSVLEAYNVPWATLQKLLTTR